MNMNFLCQLEAHFYEMKDLPAVSWEGLLNALKNESICQKDIIQCTVDHPKYKHFLPSISFIRNFLKNLIALLEENEIEVDDTLYTCYVDLISKPDTKEDFYYRVHVPHQDVKIMLRETKNLIIDGTTGMRTWEASDVLIEYCLEKKAKFSSSSIVELGSGLGLVGLTMAQCCNLKSFHFSDHHSRVLETLAHNVNNNLNLVHDGRLNIGENYRWKDTNIALLDLDWERDSISQPFDFIIGADILFDPNLFNDILRVISSAFKLFDQCEAIIAATIRNEETVKLFIELCDKWKFCVKTEERLTKKQSCHDSESKVVIISLKQTS